MYNNFLHYIYYYNKTNNCDVMVILYTYTLYDDGEIVFINVFFSHFYFILLLLKTANCIYMFDVMCV